MNTILADEAERFRLVDCTYLGSGSDRSDDAGDAEARVTRLLEQATGIELSAAHAIGKRTTVEGASLHVKAAAVLKAQGKHADTCTSAEYMAALEQAEQEIDDYDRGSDLIVA